MSRVAFGRFQGVVVGLFAMFATGGLEAARAAPPVADAGGPYPITEGDPVALDASGSSDPDLDPLTWTWDLDDDGVFGDVSGETPSVPWLTLVSFGIDDDSTYAVSVAVDDGAGGADTATAFVTVSNLGPNLSATGPGNVGTGQPYTLTLAATDPGDDTITQWVVNWGDGAIDVLPGNPGSALHTYLESGFTRGITISATDEDGTWTPSDLLVGTWSTGTDDVHRYDGSTGAADSTLGSSGGSLDRPYSATIGPDGDIFVCGYDSDNVVRYDSDGNYLGVFASGNGLSMPVACVFGPDGNLYVSSYGSDEVLRYDGSTGAFLDVFGGGAPLQGPAGLTFGPDGDLYVSGWGTGKLVKLDGTTGGTPTTLVNSGLGTPEQLAFDGAGDLYISTGGFSTVKKWDGSALTTYFTSPLVSFATGLAFGPDGRLYVGSYNNSRVVRYDGVTAEVFVPTGSGGLSETEYLAFTPVHRVKIGLPPTADAGGPYAIAEGDSVTLDGSGSADPDLDPLTWDWDLDGDGLFDDATGETPALSWAELQAASLDDDGVYPIGLRVSDGGSADSALSSITITNTPPTLLTTGTGTTETGVPYVLGLAASDPGADTIAYWTIHWGDGAIDSIAGNPPNAQHTYTAAGFTRSILASVTDEDGTFLQNELLVPSFATDNVIRFAPTTGESLQVFGSLADGLDGPSEVVVGPNGDLYVSATAGHSVLRYDLASGAFLGAFVTPSAGGLSRPEGLAFGPDGNLYVGSSDTAEVLRFDGATGTFLDAVVSSGSAGLDTTGAIVFGPDGDLWVGSRGSDRILRYDAANGAPVDSIVVGSGDVQDFTFGPDGHLYVAFRITANVERYEVATGTSLGDFVPPGSGGLEEPRGLAFGPDGQLHVTSSGAEETIRRYDGRTGAYLGDHVAPGTAGLDAPFFFTFRPGHLVRVDSTGVDLEIVKGVDTPLVGEGDPVIFDVVLTNHGPEAATGVSVTDVLPAGVTFQAGSATRGTYVEATGLWALGSLGIAASDTLFLTATIDSGTGGTTIVNTAFVAGVDQTDLVPGNDSDSASVDVLPTFVPSFLEISALGQSTGPLRPGGPSFEVLRLQIVNTAAVPETLSAVTVSNATIGPGSPAQLGAEWSPLSLALPPAPGTFAAVFAGSLATFSGIDREIAPGDTAVLVVTAGASLLARDGDLLDLAVTDSSDVVFRRPVQLSGAWPLDPTGAFPVDGMSAAQIALSNAGRPANLLTGSLRNVAAELVVPANGYEADTLRYLNVRNDGTAVHGADITRMEAWFDFDSDGTFDPDGGDAPGRLGEMLHTGNRWEKTALALPIPPGGVRVFLSCDIADQATVGSTLRLVLPTEPDRGIGVESPNDGPVDIEVGHPTTQTITTSDRVTFSSIELDSSQVAPGEPDVPLLRVVVTNDYPSTRTITGLAVRNVTTGPGTQAELDTEVGQLRLRADSVGTAELAHAIFSGGRASFSTFTLALAAGESRELIVTADVSSGLAADGDDLGLVLGGEGDVTLTGPATVVASWPVDSGGRARVDGMLASRITNHGTPPVTLGPSEGPAPALDFTLPSNGYLPDVLRELRVVNLGTATSSDVTSMQLWRDGGDGAFDGGSVDDTPLGPLGPFGNEWVNPSLSDALPVGGARYFVSVSSAAVVTDSATVRLAIPRDGVAVDSGNDGPLDVAVVNPETLTFSTAALLASLDVEPDRSTLGDSDLTATMTVRNVSGGTIENVTPSALMPGVPGVVSIVSGPVPAATDLAPDAQATFTWICSADSAGSVRLSGSAGGTEQGSGIPRQSLGTTSDVHRVFVQAQDLDVFPVESMPFSINRGQTGVVPLSLTFTNGAGADGSDVRITDLRIRLENESGSGIVPADLLSRIVVNEGTNVYLDRTSLETTGDFVDLPLVTPVLVPGEEAVTLSLSLDIADSTTVPTFRVVIPDSTAPWFVAEDATNQAPVAIRLVAGETYPIRSGLARIAAEAIELDVAAVPAPDYAVGRGQTDVSLLQLSLLNPDPDSLAADIRLSSFAVTLIDSAGTPVAEPDLWLDRIRVQAPFQTMVDRPVTAADDSTVGLLLSPLLSLPVNAPVTLDVRADISGGAPLGSLRLRLSSAGTFDARDANTGAAVPVVYATQPVEGPELTVQVPADSVVVAGRPELPGTLPIGSANVPALTVFVQHPGGAGTSAVRIEEITLRCQAGSADLLVPATYLDRVWATVGGTEVGALTDLPTSGGELTLPIDVTLAPGTSDSIRVILDGEVASPAGPFEMTIAATGLRVVDVNDDGAVACVAAPGTGFPLSSGLTQLSAPARELRVAFEDAMPAVLTADGTTFPFARVTLRNPAPSTSGGIRVNGLEIRAGDEDLAALAIGAAFSRIEAWSGGAIWAASGDLVESAATAQLVALTDLDLPPGQTSELELRGQMRGSVTVPSVRLGLESAGIGVVQPTSTLLSISVLPEDQHSFPFWTLAGNFAAATFEESWSNFPNPFAAGRSETRFVFFLPEPAVVTLELYTLRGERVTSVLDGIRLPAGLHQDRTWDGRNGGGQVVLNGVYVAAIRAAFDDGTSERLLRKVAVVR